MMRARTKEKRKRSARKQRKRRQEMMNWNKGGSRDTMTRHAEPEIQDEQQGDRILASDPL